MEWRHARGEGGARARRLGLGRRCVSAAPLPRAWPFALLVLFACAAGAVRAQGAAPPPVQGGIGAVQPASLAGRRVLHVGPTRELTRPSDAARVARDGDIVEIDAGPYPGDHAVWRANDLILRGVGGMVQLDAAGKNIGDKGIWVIDGNNTIVENIEFSGAKVPDKNGAGIRQEGLGLTVRHCYFHDNQEGILTNNVPRMNVLIEDSRFRHNGQANGQAHNIYIGAIHSFTLRFSDVDHANVGSDVKSRAKVNYILYNRFLDGFDGQTNYSIDLSNGGVAYVIGNVIDQSPRTENYHIIAFAPEGAKGERQQLFLVNNTLVNFLPTGRFVWNNTRSPAYLYDNLFVGAGDVMHGPAVMRGNILAQPRTLLGRARQWLGLRRSPFSGLPGSGENRQVRDAGFVALSRQEFWLRPGSPAIGSGIAVTEANGVDLRALFYPEGPGKRVRRPLSEHPDIGAFGVRR